MRGNLGSVEKAPISIEFVSVPYDNQRAVENVRKAADWFESPESYIREITTGTWQPGL